MTNVSDARAPALVHYGPQVVGLIVFALALWAQVGDAYAGRFLEDGLNLVLAKALARGEGLTFIHYPYDVPARWVYPVYPIVVGLVGRLWPNFPDNLVLIQILDSALLGCAAWILSLQVRRVEFAAVGAFAAVLLGFASVSVLSLSVSAFAEPLFLALTAGAVLLADRERITASTGVAAAVLAGVAAITSNLGVFVVVGIVLTLLVRKHYRVAALAAGVAMAIAVPWFVWSFTTVDTTGLAATAVSTARDASEMNGAVTFLGAGPLVHLLFEPVPRWLMPVLAPVAVAFFGVGVLAVYRVTPALSIVVTACVLGAWLHPSGVPRNEWILFPWFLLLLSIGARRSWGYTRTMRIPVFVAFAALFVIYVPRTIVSVVGREFAESLVEQNDGLRALVMSINAELPEGIVIASDAEAMIHLYTGRLVMPARVPDGDVVDAYCDANVQYVALTNLPVPSAIDDQTMVMLGDSVTNVFSLTNGPALYRFTCPR